MMVTFVVYNSVSVPFLAAFDPENKLGELEAIEYTIDALFAIDIVASFFTSYLDPNGDEVLDHRKIVRNYGCGYKFPLDLITVIPLETILYEELNGKVKSKTLKLLSLIKLKRMVRLRRVISLLRFKKAFKLYIRILMVIFLLFLFVHLAGSFWFMLVEGAQEWVAPKDIGKGVDFYAETVWVQYTTSLYYATILFLGVDSLPTTTSETIYSSIIIYLGAVLSAALFGQMTALVQSLNSKSAQYNEALDRVTQAMVNIKAPKDLQEKVTEYVMSTYWRRDQQEELGKFFETLSPSLKLEVCTKLYREVLVGNTVLGTSQEGVDLMVRNLAAKLCKPEDVLLYYEDLGSEMYILVTGEVSVRCPDFHGVESHVRFLGPGDYFGEISLLFPVRRTATIVTVNFCTLAVLERPAFTELCDRFPFIRAYMLDYAATRYNEEWKTEIMKVLSAVPYFQGCSRFELTQIYYALRTERYEVDTVLANRNDPVDRFFILATGKLIVSAPRRDGSLYDILLLESGSAGLFCSCLTEKKHQFSIRVHSDACLLFLSPASIHRTSHPDFSDQFPTVKTHLKSFLKKDAKNKARYCDYYIPPYRLYSERKVSLLKLTTLKLMRETRKKRLKDANSLIDGLLSAIEKYVSAKRAEKLDTARTPEEAFEFLIVKMMEDTVNLNAKVARLVRETENQLKLAEMTVSEGK